MNACNCVGPQYGQPHCPCQMRGLYQRDGKWVEPERVVGDVVPTFYRPGHGSIASHGCVCPPGAEKTCAGPLCPRKPIGSAGAVA